ncbi:MAG: hypothetical protein Q7S87_01480 [Agitococcus sp.]|nr:hypothetical protein [Agitococcus sp.]
MSAKPSAWSQGVSATSMTLAYLRQQLRTHLVARNHKNAYVRKNVRIALHFEVARLRTLK